MLGIILSFAVWRRKLHRNVSCDFDAQMVATPDVHTDIAGNVDTGRTLGIYQWSYPGGMVHIVHTSCSR